MYRLPQAEVAYITALPSANSCCEVFPPNSSVHSRAPSVPSSFPSAVQFKLSMSRASAGSAMGDIIHTLPAVAWLKQSHADSHLTWLVEPRWAPLLEENPHVDRVVLLRR